MVRAPLASETMKKKKPFVFKDALYACAKFTPSAPTKPIRGGRKEPATHSDTPQPVDYFAHMRNFDVC